MQGKVIAITGGASGIGLALAKLLSSRGALLSLADLQINALTRAADSIRELGGKVITNVVDVRNPAEVDAFLDATVNEYGRLDGAANLAGVIGRTMYKVTTADLSNEDWEFVMGINATGVFNCVRKELQIIVDGGSIVNAASVLGLRGTEKNPAYSASKHAVVGLTKSAAADSGHRNIRVNAVAPYVQISIPLHSRQLRRAANSK
jgi:NAD(P)-dependent dehydrogenase (short-subunit alcohol dehydrogenase family)